MRNKLTMRKTSKQLQLQKPINQNFNRMVTSNTFPETADIETSSEDYATRFAGEIGKWLLQVQQEATLRMLKPYPQAKILDVGGGHGQLTGALIEHGYQVTVLGSAEVCRARIQKYLDRDLCSFQVGNVLNLPYIEGAFDVAISYRFLTHVTQWQKFLEELARVSSKAVIIDYPTVRSANAIAPYLFKVKKALEGNTRPFTCYQEKEIIDFYKSIGWVKKQRYGQFFLPMVLHRTLGVPPISSTLERLSCFSGLSYLFGSPVIAKFSKL